MSPLAAALAKKSVNWAAGARRPLVVGLCGPQGSGKSTLAEEMRRAVAAKGLATAVLSLDDLYLGRAERRALAAAVHPLCATRGPPGTHDVALGERLLDQLGQPGPIALPRFDKSTDDRGAPIAFDGPAEVVIFEGWCVGARPQPKADLTTPVNALEAEADPDGAWRRWSNAALAGPYQRLFARIDRLILLQAPLFEIVTRWRQEQERALGPRALMTDAEVARFVQHYERLTRWIATEMPSRADLVVRLDEARRPGPTDGQWNGLVLRQAQDEAE